MWMDTEGKPILLSVILPRAYEADFVLATLLDVGPDNGDTATATSQSTSESRSTASPKKQPASNVARNNKSSIASVSDSRSTGSPADVSQIQQGSPATPHLHTPPPLSSAQKRAPPQATSASSLQSSTKRLRIDDEEDNEDLLWDKDMQSNVLRDNGEDSEDVPDSQEE